MGGDMTGKSPTGDDEENLGRKNYFGGGEGTIFLVWHIF
jgi:hypothetical protein